MKNASSSHTKDKEFLPPNSPSSRQPAWPARAELCTVLPGAHSHSPRRVLPLCLHKPPCRAMKGKHHPEEKPPSRGSALPSCVTLRDLQQIPHPPWAQLVPFLCPPGGRARE